MKLFVTDIDDTLSVGETVSPEVRSACARLRDSGWDIMIATGRTYGTARHHMDAIGVTQPAILYDGSRIMTQDGKEIHSSLFDLELASELLDYLWPLPLEIQIAGDEDIHCREKDVETASFYKQAGVPVHYVSAPFAEGPIYRIGLWVRPDDLPEMEHRLQTAFEGKIEVTAGGREFLDLLPFGVSKGSALERFLSTLPQRPEVVVAAGDHKNDFEMLRASDIAAVPCNAAEPLFSVADIVIPKALDHGVRFLADHLLSPEFRALKRDVPMRLQNKP